MNQTTEAKDKTMKAICKQTVKMDDTGKAVFIQGKEYREATKEDIELSQSYPAEPMHIALMDEDDEVHYMDRKWFNQNFQRVK